MKRFGFTLWEIIAVVALLLIGAMFLLPVRSTHGPNPEGRRRTACYNNLKQLGMALMQYQSDYDGRCPTIAFSGRSTVNDKPAPVRVPQYYGWADVIFPYVKQPLIYHCPGETEKLDSGPYDPTARGYTDYWLNSNIAGLRMVETKAPGKTIAFGDGNDGGDLTNARYNLPALPTAWISDKKSPAYRHMGGANYAFVDGHVKWLKPEQIANDPVAPNGFTFAPR